MYSDSVVLFMGQLFLYHKVTERGEIDMKTMKDIFTVTEGYLLVMEKKREKEERQKYIWDVEDDSYCFEES